MTEIWQHSKQEGSRLLVLLAIADFANDEGIAWPSVQTLRKKARLSERAVHYALRALVDAGELRARAGEGPHGTNLFQVIPQAATDAPGVQTLQGANPAPVQNMSGGVQPVAPKPSLEPSITQQMSTPVVAQPSKPKPKQVKPEAVQFVDDVIGKCLINSALYSRVEKIIAVKRDAPFLRQCFESWVERGYKQTNLAWLTDWYVKGQMPDRRNGNEQKESHAGKPIPGYKVADFEAVRRAQDEVARRKKERAALSQVQGDGLAVPDG